MKEIYNFGIQFKGEISDFFIARKIIDFVGASNFIKQLPYGRNNNKNDLTSLFFDNCGTCSTKHALLKSLAIEQFQDDVKLNLGIFKMNGQNTPAIRQTLMKHNLD